MPGRRRLAVTGEDGFILMESIIAISLITIIMGALTVFFTSTIQTSNHLRFDQSAAQLADSAVEQVRAIDATSITSGRDSASVTTQNSAAPALVRTSWLPTMSPVSDASAPAGAGATPCPSTAGCALLPTVPLAKSVGTRTFNVNYYVGACYRPNVGSAATCAATNVSGYLPYLRVVVAVTWADSSCAQCLYITSTLANASADPLFNLNSIPPPPPDTTSIVAPNQSSVVGDVVNYALTTSAGVPPFNWTATNLPAGLAIDGAGVISGRPTAVSSPTVSVTVTDAFLRTATKTFTWSIGPALAAADPPDQTTVRQSAISPVTLAASGGSNTGYTWTDPTSSLPPGIVLSTGGVLSGSPSAVGVWAVTLVVTDSAQRHATASLQWTVDYPPLTASQGPVSSTAGRPVSVTVHASGGSGSYGWSDPTGSLAAAGLGLSLSSGGTIAGTPSAAGSYPVRLTVTDPATGASRDVSFTWTVADGAPAITSPGDQRGTAGTTVNVALPYTCPSGPCVISATGLPTGLQFNGASIIGTLPAPTSGASQTWSAIQLSITDSSNQVVQASATFQWVVFAPPTLTATNQSDVIGGAVDGYPVTAQGGTAPYTWSASGLPAGLHLANTVTGEVTGTPTTAGTYSNIVFTVHDAKGSVVSSSAFTWTIKQHFTLLSVANTALCAGLSGYNGYGYHLTAAGCNAAFSLTYTPTIKTLQLSAGVCVQGYPNTAQETGSAGCSSATSQAWLFRADGTILNVGANQCLHLPTGATSGTLLDLVTCSTTDPRQQWNVQ